jgi:aryl-alcohol dehydrogenase-like predicted oxidoreductase
MPAPERTVTFSGISLGCGNFGGVGSAPEFFGQGIPEDEAFAIMDRAWANGLHWFDTGDAYGGGTSETWIGRWRADHAATDLAITTKVFHSTTGDPDDTGLAPDRIRRQLDSSLGRLGVERVDLYLAHEPDPDTPVADTIACFEQLAGEGLVGAWGLSNYDADGIEEALRHGRPSLIQNTYSLLDRGDEERVLPLCAEHGFAYVPFGPLSGGWLTGKYRRDEPPPEGSRMTLRPDPYLHLRDERVYAALDALERVAQDRGASMAGIALAWLGVDPRVSEIVVGPRRPEHLDPVREALRIDLSAADRDRLGREFSL